MYTVGFLYYLFKKHEGMGEGDIALLAMIGAATGIDGVIFTIFTGSLLGTLYGILIMLYTKKADTKLRIPFGKLKIPFGPFLSAGAVLYIFYGEGLINWYCGKF